MGDLEKALAFVARRSGRQSMPSAEWTHHLSLGLGWMTPAHARAFVERAAAAGVLAGRDGVLQLAGEAQLVEIPLGFRPNPEAVAATAEADPFAALLQRVAAHTGSTVPAVLSLVSERQARMGGLLTAWAALLWLAAEAGLDVRQAATIRA